ncbi:MAG: TIGR00266 family protein, partial [Candidatus Obscuribacterales bacterium]|nr:TIGR00266 family protein [Candidatus Obscuribacterales bacterium]
MHYEIVHPGSNALINATLETGEHFQAEAGAMVSRSESIDVEGTLHGGIGRSIKRSLLGGETLFFQTLRASRGPGEVLVAPAMLGDIKVLSLEGGQDYFVKNGSLLASFESVTLDTKMQKLSTGFFSGAGLFVIHAHGQGHIAVSAFGAVMEVSVAPGERYVVDNGHLVAWTGDIDYR